MHQRAKEGKALPSARNWLPGALAGAAAALLATTWRRQTRTGGADSSESTTGTSEESQEPTQRELSQEANEKIRDAGKWLVGAFAAVGAALIAGSQLSSIGKLGVCGHLTVNCTRLWIALLGAAIGLAGVVWAIWTAVSLLIPESPVPADLIKEWKKGAKSPIYSFFVENPVYLQGFKDFADVQDQNTNAYAVFDDLSSRFDAAKDEKSLDLIKKEMEAQQVELEDIGGRTEAALAIASQVSLEKYFKSRALSKLLVAAILAALGIGLFAWAANPPEVPKTPSLRGANLAGADLRGVSLRNADLREASLVGADLTGADLEGSDLTDANVDGVTWSSTTCPDGKNSNDVAGTCLNHLTP